MGRKYKSKEPNTKNFGYQILETKPLQEGVEFLLSLPKKRMFSRKHVLAELCKTNTKCVCCDVEGTKFMLGRHNTDNSLHWDLYTDDDIALSLDHIIPRANGGKDHIDNIQIMCVRCNWFKSNKPWRLEVFKKLIDAGLDINLVTYGKAYIRIGFWKKMPYELYEEMSCYLDEEEIEDADCGWQYTYYFKKEPNFILFQTS
jgi:hypothetical protein